MHRSKVLGSVRMPVSALRLSVACLLVLLGFGSMNAAAQEKGSNPIRLPKTAAPTLPPERTGQLEPQDYRQNPEAQRQRRPKAEELPLFGYTFFEPARQMIDARRAALARAGRSAPPPEPQKTETSLTAAAPGPAATGLSIEELAAAAKLTDTQKADLRKRAEEGQLTTEEQRLYQAMLEQLRREDLLQVGRMSDAEKSDLRRRAAEGTLSPADQRIFKLLTSAVNTPVAAQQAPTGSQQSADAFKDVIDPLAQLYQNIRASVPATYQLSGGDKVTLRYWSPTLAQSEIELTVDSTGAVVLPEAGRTVVRGQTLAGAEVAIRQKLSSYIRGVQVSLAMQELRTITVTVSGEAYMPGSYIVPAAITAYNLLYATGGPSRTGSFRAIEVRRRGEIAGTIDLYKFLQTGEKSADIALEAGDILYVPPAMTRITLRGEVRRPAIFELLPAESLKDALRFAGGARSSAVAQRVQLQTVVPGSARVYRDVSLADAQSGSIELHDDDEVEVFSLRSVVQNKVAIDGAVDQPGEYALTAGMTVADLIERARGLTDEAYPARADLIRWNPDSTLTLIPVTLDKAMQRDGTANLALVRWDRIRIYTREDLAFTGRRDATVRGAVKKPGKYYRSDNLHVRDLLLQAGGTLPEAYIERAVLLHEDGDGTFSYDYVNLAAAMRGEVSHNVAIRDRDILAVYRTEEAKFTPDHVIDIRGEIVSSGLFPRGEGMKLSDAIKLAGGFTPRAGDRVTVTHARADAKTVPISADYSPSRGAFTPDPILQDGDVITVQGRGEYLARPRIAIVEGEVNRPGPVVLPNGETTLSEVIELAGGLRKDAFPQGAELTRDAAYLGTEGQRQLSVLASKLNDLINQADYQLELARSDIEKAKALGGGKPQALPISIPGVDLPSAVQPASATVEKLLASRDLAVQPRVLGPGDLQPGGNVAIDLPAALREPRGADDIFVRDSDRIVVPVRPTTVRVVGAVVQPRGAIYKPGYGVDDYVALAGGYAADAARDRILVIRLGLGLTPVRKAKSIEPGDVILVPNRVLSRKLTNRTPEIEAFFRSLASGAIAYQLAAKLVGF